MNGKLTLKQRKFWKHYQLTHSLSQSAKYAGSKGKDVQSLSSIGYDLLKSLELSMPELLNAEGLDDKSLLEPLKNGIKAQKPLIATWEGKITDQLWIEDHPTQLKAVELIGRMKGAFIDRTELTGRDGGDIMLQVAPMRSKRDTKQIDMDVD